jgi:hypothetical protein
LPWTRSSANFRRCAWLLKGMGCLPALTLAPVDLQVNGRSIALANRLRLPCLTQP